MSAGASYENSSFVIYMAPSLLEMMYLEMKGKMERCVGFL